MSMLSKALRKSGLNKPLKFAAKAAPYVAGAMLIPGVGGALGKVAGGAASLASKIPGVSKVGGLAKAGLGAIGLGGGAPTATTANAGSMTAAGVDLAPTIAGAQGTLADIGGAAQGLGGRLLGIAEKYPNAISGALQAAGSLSGRGSERRLMDAQTARLEQGTEESAYDLEQRRQREEQLRVLFAELGISPNEIAPNPYVTGG